MKMDEKSLDQVSGGFKTVELKDGSFAIVADSAEVYSSAEEAQKAIAELEKDYQFRGFGFHHKGHHGPHDRPHHGPFQGPSERDPSGIVQFPHIDQ